MEEEYGILNYKEGSKWFRLAAEQGEVSAQFYMGVFYQEGLGVSKDIKESIKWYRLAAEQGYAAAQIRLGRAYAHGKGVIEDKILAYMWTTIGSRGDELEKIFIDIIIKDLTSSQIEDANRLVKLCISNNYKGC